MQLGHRVDEREAEPSADIGMSAHRPRHVPPDDLAARAAP